VELQQPVPTLMVDAAYAARSLAVIVSHAMQTANRETGIRIGCEQSEQTDPSGRELARVWIEYAADSVAPELLAAQLRGRSPSSVGRGVALRLGLARSLIELHGGHVEVERSPQGTAKVVCWLPRTQRDHPDTGGQC
jgi:K+-sensing histidine kinase KdpD